MVRICTKLGLLPGCTAGDAEAQPPRGALGGCSGALSTSPRYAEESQHPWFQICATPWVFCSSPLSLCSELVKHRKRYELGAKCRSPDRHQSWKETPSKSARSPTELSLRRKTLHFFRDRKRWPLALAGLSAADLGSSVVSSGSEGEPS